MRLRSYLIALVLSTMVPLVIITVVSTWWAMIGERAKEEAGMSRLATAAGNAVEVAIGRGLVMAQTLAAAPALVEQGDRAAFEALARRAASATGIDVLVGGRDGVQYINTWVAPGQPINAQLRPDIAELVIAGDRPFLMEVQPSPRTGLPISAILVPTRGLEGEDFVVAVRIEPERLAALLPKTTRWRDGFAALFDSTGTLVALADGAPESARQLRVETIPNQMPRLVWPTEDRLYAALAAVGDTGWKVAVGAPQAAIAEALRQKVWMIAAVGAVGLLLAMAAAMLLARFLLRETQTLVAAAERIAQEIPELPKAHVWEINRLRRALMDAGLAVRERAAAMAQLRAVAEDAALLERRVGERTRELEETTGQLLNAQDEERRRIAREIHDSTVQELIAASLALAQAESVLDSKGRRQAGAAIAEARASLTRAQEELRTVSFILQPPLLDECGLATAMQVYAEGFSKRTGIAVSVKAPDSRITIPRAVETALFRVMQEMLANVHRHSGAKGATIQFSESAAKLVLQIADDGCGMPVSGQGGGYSEGVGIPGMRARLRQLGGILEIHSTSSGTQVMASVPKARVSSGTPRLRLDAVSYVH